MAPAAWNTCAHPPPKKPWNPNHVYNAENSLRGLLLRAACVQVGKTQVKLYFARSEKNWNGEGDIDLKGKQYNGSAVYKLF